MEKIRIEKRDLLWSYIGSIFRLATNILLLPIILAYLTEQDLGLWYVFATISQLVTLLDFGFAPALSRNISYVWCGAKKIDKEEITSGLTGEMDIIYFKKVLTACQYIYMFISVLSVIILLTFGSYYIHSLSSDTNIIIAWSVYSIGVFLNTLYSYYTSFLRGVGAVAENNKAGVYSKAIQIFLTFILLYLGYGLLGVSIAYLISGVVLRLYSKYYFFNYQGIGVLLGSVKITDKVQESFNILKIIWHNASRDGLVTIANFLSTQANTLICSSTLGLVTTGSYGLSLQLATVLASLSGIPFSAFQPAMQEKAVKNDSQGSLSLYATSMTLYVVMFVILSMGLVVVMPVIKYLKPNIEINYLMLGIILLQMLIYQLYQHAASYISTFNIIPYTKSFVLSSLASVILSYVMAKYTAAGIWALIITPLGVSLLYNAWKWPLSALSRSHADFKTFVYQGCLGSINYIKSFFR